MSGPVASTRAALERYFRFVQQTLISESLLAGNGREARQRPGRRAVSHRDRSQLLSKVLILAGHLAKGEKSGWMFKWSSYVEHFEMVVFWVST